MKRLSEIPSPPPANTGAALSDNQNSEYLWKSLESGFEEIAL